MVLSGEGADETLAGYLYFHKVYYLPFQEARKERCGGGEASAKRTG